MGLWFFCCWAAAVDREPCAASQGCCGAPRHTYQSGMGNRLRQCVMRRPRSVVLPDQFQSWCLRSHGRIPVHDYLEVRLKTALGHLISRDVPGNDV